MLFQLRAALFDDGNYFRTVLVMRVKLLKQSQVVLPEAHGALPGLVRWVAQQLQHAACAAQAGLKHLALDPHHAPVAQLVPVGHVSGSSHDLQLRKVLFGQVDDLDRLLHIVHRHHQNFGAGRACGAQQIKPGGIAVKHTEAKGAHGFNHFGVVVQHGGRNALGQQHAANDLPVAAKPGNDDGGGLLLGYFFHRWAIAVGVAGQQQLVDSYQQQRRDKHRQRHRTNQQ